MLPRRISLAREDLLGSQGDFETNCFFGRREFATSLRAKRSSLFKKTLLLVAIRDDDASHQRRNVELCRIRSRGDNVVVNQLLAQRLHVVTLRSSFPRHKFVIESQPRTVFF